MKVLVIGANGNTATRVLRLLKQGPHQPLAMIRQPSQREKFDALGVPTVLGDLEYPIDHAIAGCEAVIFAAGSGARTGKDKTVLVDHLGAIRAAVSAQIHGARRFVMLSALNADVHSTSRIAHYHRAKAHADNFLRGHHEVLTGEPLAWTIVCPGGLTDEPTTGQARISSDLHGEGRTSRDLLAQVLVACLDRPNTIGRCFSLLDGQTPLEEALAAV